MDQFIKLMSVALASALAVGIAGAQSSGSSTGVGNDRNDTGMRTNAPGATSADGRAVSPSGSPTNPSTSNQRSNGAGSTTGAGIGNSGTGSTGRMGNSNDGSGSTGATGLSGTMSDSNSTSESPNGTNGINNRRVNDGYGTNADGSARAARRDRN